MFIDFNLSYTELVLLPFSIFAFAARIPSLRGAPDC